VAYVVVVRFRRPRYRGIAPLLPVGSKMSRREYEVWRDAHTWDPARETDLVVQTDLAPAAWLEPLLVPGSFEVRMTAPQGFDAYARIFFPFVVADAADGADGQDGQEFITWRELARRNGRIAHALMEHETIAAGPDGGDAGVLLPILTRHTSSSEGWFLLWDGFGDLNERVFSDAGPKVRHPTRSFFLLRGPLGAYDAFPDQPSYWWPDDRAWCVCTDVDFEWAYLAGAAACMDEVLAVAAIDAFGTRPENPARSGMDVVNDPDAIVPRQG
jgi:hypothetical protein